MGGQNLPDGKEKGLAGVVATAAAAAAVEEFEEVLAGDVAW